METHILHQRLVCCSWFLGVLFIL